MLTQENEHWIFQLIPRYVRKPHEKKYERRVCTSCNGRSGFSLFALDQENCECCHNTGFMMVTIHEPVPAPPEIPLDYVEHMRQAHKSYMERKT